MNTQQEVRADLLADILGGTLGEDAIHAVEEPAQDVTAEQLKQITQEWLQGLEQELQGLLGEDESEEEPDLPQPPQVKALRKKPEAPKVENYFARCERDEGGHCLPEGGTGNPSTDVEKESDNEWPDYDWTEWGVPGRKEVVDGVERDTNNAGIPFATGKEQAERNKWVKWYTQDGADPLEWNEVEVPVDLLLATQSYATREFVGRYRQMYRRLGQDGLTSRGRGIEGILFNGRIHIMEGHHRASAAKMEGLKTVRILLAKVGRASESGFLPRPPSVKSLPYRYFKDQGQPCQQGETSANTGCIPESGQIAPAKTTRSKQPTPSAHPGAAHGSSVTIKPAQQRAFTGKPVATKTTLTKQETGRVGEAVVIAWLKYRGAADARQMNTGKTNFPVDALEDHRPTEIKAGLVSNGTKAQQWRLTFSQESKAEKALYESMTPEERAAWNADKQKRIHERKRAVIAQLEKETGQKITPRTITVIVNPDTRTADIYEFDGLHDRIGWNSEMAQKGYVGSVIYE